MIKAGYIADFNFVCELCGQSNFDISLTDLLRNFRSWTDANQCRTCGDKYRNSYSVPLGKLALTTKSRIHKMPSARTRDTELVVAAKQFEKTVDTVGFSKDDLLHKFNLVMKQLLQLHELASNRMFRRKPKQKGGEK